MNSHNQLVSVIMSVYNAEKYLRDTLESICSQTYPHIELIIVDDASTDSSLEIIQEFSERLNVNIIKHSKNMKLAFSLNEAIELSKGDFLARMDADDIMPPDRIKIQVEYLNSHPKITVVGGQAVKIGMESSRLSYPLTHEEIKAQLLFENALAHPAVMVRKNILYKYDTNCLAGQDYDLWSKLIWKVEFANVSDIVLNYNVHDKQTRFVLNTYQLESANKARINMLNHINSNYTDEKINVFLGFCNVSENYDISVIVDLLLEMINDNSNYNNFNDSALKFAVKNKFEKYIITNLARNKISLSTALKWLRYDGFGKIKYSLKNVIIAYLHGKLKE